MMSAKTTTFVKSGRGRSSALSKLAVAGLCLSLVACVSTPDNADRRKEAAKKGISNVTFTNDLPEVPFDSLLSARVYPKLRSGDKANVKVFGFEDLTGVYIVNRDGSVVFPLIGRQQVEGLDALELQQKLTEEYGRDFVQNPSVTVEVETAALGRIVVDGAVEEPDVFELGAPMKLSEAIAMAGGLSEEADEDLVHIVRTVDGERYVQTVALGDLRTLGGIEPQIIPNDFVFVENDVNRQRFEDLLTLVPALNLATIIATR